jgi:hypothetical protein
MPENTSSPTTKKFLVRWSAVYETVMEVPDCAEEDSQLIKDNAANIPIDVPGSEYQVDTWEVESINPL